MANQQHLEILKQGINVWNKWKSEHLDVKVDLTQADLGEAYLNGVDLYRANLLSINLSGANLSGAKLNAAKLSKANLNRAYLSKAELHGTDLSNAILSRANLSGAQLNGANLSEANLSEAILSGAFLLGANLSGALLPTADLSGAHLYSANLSRALLSEADLRNSNLQGADISHAGFRRADLSGANLIEANLQGADFTWANLSEANLSRADLTECRVYAVSAWNVHLEETTQLGLIITRQDEPNITVDNLEVAQFIYLLLNNQKIRDVIDTITSKVALILGRFTPERKQVLDALKDELRKHNYLPILFDFDKPASRDLTETITTLAHLARFIIVDLTDPCSASHEVATIIPQTIVPVQPLLTLQPLIVDGKAIERHEYAMFEDLRRRYHWVLPTFRYQDTSDLLASLQQQVIAPAEQKAKELAQR